MTEFTFLELLKDTMFLAFLLSLPMLAISTLVGVIISVIQTATSIQDQSLSFIPKLLATVASLVAFGPWMLSLLMQFTFRLLSGLQNFAR
ncbi:MAG: Flagellar biosynthesis protein FliQ [Candidatus Ozemobacter sibiricus]|jgi:flagellar biosynthetic protein FliQ|uniref:Flagellar biosynthesis protein FliQ n=1 Tax=Candidatus Ozemobacter sibiricus TaxID=2268124 RepID=A0A367ZBP2_9BACT|nr:MAG: Flagellar biosynthesis protein FliQ [Candidatus Ozemobacter sibiricus]